MYNFDSWNYSQYHLWMRLIVLKWFKTPDTLTRKIKSYYPERHTRPCNFSPSRDLHSVPLAYLMLSSSQEESENTFQQTSKKILDRIVEKKLCLYLTKDSWPETLGLVKLKVNWSVCVHKLATTRKNTRVNDRGSHAGFERWKVNFVAAISLQPTQVLPSKIIQTQNGISSETPH